MFFLVLLALVGVAILIVATDQFVTGASRVAEGMRASSVLVGAVILGCGIGLPELALAFHGERESPLRAFLGVDDGTDLGLGVLIAGVALVLVLTYPMLFPDRARRHSPIILMATVLFAVLLRGSLDRIEGIAMLVGFAVGIAWVIHRERDPEVDPYAPMIDDDYTENRAFIEAPVMTPLQLDATRSLLGLFGTLLGAQLLARSAEGILSDFGYGAGIQGLVLVGFGSVLPHVVVALQALRHHHEGLAIGNLIGSNLFHSLAVGGLVSIIKPYELGGAVGVTTFVIGTATAVITYMLLHAEDEMSRRQAIALVGAYVCLAVTAVP